MAISKETQEWLNELQSQGNLSTEAFAQLKSSVEANSKADEFIKGSALRQSDYSRKQAELQTARQDFEKTQNDLKTREAAVSKFQTDLGEWKTGADTKIVDALRAREAAETKAAAALAKLQRIGAQSGLDESEWKIGDEELKNVNKEPVGFDTSKFLTQDQLKEQIGRGTREAALLDAMVADLAEDHRELFGTRLPNKAQLVNEALASGKPLTQFWEEKYGVAAKKAELAEAQIQERIRQGVETEKAKWASDAALPGGVNPFRNEPRSPVLREGGLAAPPEAGGGGVSAAIAAFNSGKFKTGR